MVSLWGDGTTPKVCCWSELLIWRAEGLVVFVIVCIVVCMVGLVVFMCLFVVSLFGSSTIPPQGGSWVEVLMIVVWV